MTAKIIESIGFCGTRGEYFITDILPSVIQKVGHKDFVVFDNNNVAFSVYPLYKSAGIVIGVIPRGEDLGRAKFTIGQEVTIMWPASENEAIVEPPQSRHHRESCPVCSEFDKHYGHLPDDAKVAIANFQTDAEYEGIKRRELEDAMSRILWLSKLDTPEAAFLIQGFIHTSFPHIQPVKP